MKDFKKDILEIIPKIKINDEEEDIKNISEKSFDEIFKDFYKKERGVEADTEVVELFLNIMSEVGEEDETN